MSEKFQRLKNERDKLGIVTKAKDDITQVEVERWQKCIHQQFASLRYDVDFGHKYESVKPLNIYVEPDPSRKCSFLLQPFLDSVFNKTLNESAFTTKKDLEKCWDVLFGDILGISEAEKQKEDSSMPNPTNYISSALKAKWNVTFTKTEEYGRSKKAKGDVH